MDTETQKRWAKEVCDAWFSGDQAKIDALCRAYEVDADPAW
jgi:hypothetical protein